MLTRLAWAVAFGSIAHSPTHMRQEGTSFNVSAGRLVVQFGGEELAIRFDPHAEGTIDIENGQEHVRIGGADILVGPLGVQTDFEGANYRIPPKLLLIDTRYPDIDSAPPGIQKNVRRTLAMNPGYEVTWLDGAACLDRMKRHAIDPKLVHKFQELSKKDGKTAKLVHDQGMIQSDICRAAYLFHEGGFYVDCDLEPAVPFAKMVDRDTGFMSAWVVNFDGARSSELQAGIQGVEPHSPIFKRQLEHMAMADEKWFGTVDFLFLGPHTLGQGLTDFIESCHEDASMISRRSDFSACGTKVRMFEEEDLRSPSSRTPTSLIQKALSTREPSNFKGNDYALFYTGDPAALIGFSRFAACHQWGCDS